MVVTDIPDLSNLLKEKYTVNYSVRVDKLDNGYLLDGRIYYKTMKELLKALTKLMKEYEE